jgi:uncharacterized paraquat-inducible protein A
MIEQLQQQMGGMFWVIAIAAPVMVLVLILQIVFKARAKVKRVKQVFRSGAVVTDRSAATSGPAVRTWP